MKRKGRGDGRRHPDVRSRVMTCLCGKLYSPTENAARSLRKEIADYSERDNKVRLYVCDYGGWHWTQEIKRKTEYSHAGR